ncbi:MAG: hypothetical protein Q7J31_14985 [Syntrophales bacterium]|nr:hypothetical protein [Syntrophales bacterium]
MKSRIRSLIFCSALSIFCFMSLPARAHRVNIHAYAGDGMVHSESYFVDGTKCKNSPIKVFNEKTGTGLLEGRTDENGKFSFKIPQITSLRLVLPAGMGHHNEYTIGEDEIRKAMESRRSSQGTDHGKDTAGYPFHPEKAGAKNRGKSEVAAGPNISMSESEMEAVMERVIDRKLQPAIAMLVKLQENSEKPGIREIVGGIGYIVGLMGVAMYLRRRFKERH